MNRRASIRERLADSAWARAGMVALALAASSVVACGVVSGLDKVTRDDGSEVDASLGTGGMLGDDGGGAQVRIADSGAITLLDGDTVVSTCVPDPTWCENRCGDVLDNCGEVRHCNPDCGANNTCDTDAGQCDCVPMPGLCANRCESITDNCGLAEDCGSCPSDAGIPETCTRNSCGCPADPVSTTCGGKQCGTAVNNCNQTVLCGSNGNCVTAGQVCLANQTCCAPDNATPCNGLCGGVQVTNNCGQTISCPATCATGEVCLGTSCCTPDNATACAGKNCGVVTNNCGQQVSCGSCTQPGYTCSGSDLCSCTPITCAGHCTATNDGCGNALNCAGYCEDRCPNGGTCLSSGACQCNTNPCSGQSGQLGSDVQCNTR